MQEALKSRNTIDATNFALMSKMQDPSDQADSANDIDSSRLNIFTLKQFRDCHDLQKACYQALIQIPLNLYQVKAIGALDKDSNGLFQIKIMNFGDFPIVEELGLVANSMVPGDGAMTYVFEPVKPFEYRVDMRRGFGKRLAKRNLAGEWTIMDPDTNTEK